jgi:histidyl-tRNA synthetase
MFTEQEMHTWQQPVMLYYEGSILPHGQKRRSGERVAHLEILGTSKSIAEATLIKTAFEVLHEEGYVNLVLDINSIGDKESVARFSRELTNYYRKHMEEMQAHCRQTFKKDVFDVLKGKCAKSDEFSYRTIASAF